MKTQAPWIAMLLLTLSPLTAGGATPIKPCDGCVQDVVVETADGRWMGGYLLWNQHPFRFLDLGSASGRRVLERGNGAELELRLWPHAVSISRSRLPSDLGAPPAPPIPESPFNTRDDEIALLVGEPIAIALAEVRRIYPRIGSGLPALEISLELLDQWVEQNLPFHEVRGGGCLGCPMTVEDVTVVLRSGELVSGLMPWHIAWQALQGYDFRDGPPQPERYQHLDWPEELTVWTEAVSAPRRSFERQGTVDPEGNLVEQRGFFRMVQTVFVMGTARVIPLPDVAFLLPGPSSSSYPLLVPRADARRVLLEPPQVAISASRDAWWFHCLGYGAEMSLNDLYEVCRPRDLDPWFSIPPPPVPPDSLVAATPGVRRQAPRLGALARRVVFLFDGGT